MADNKKDTQTNKPKDQHATPTPYCQRCTAKGLTDCNIRQLNGYGSCNNCQVFEGNGHVNHVCQKNAGNQPLGVNKASQRGHYGRGGYHSRAGYNGRVGYNNWQPVAPPMFMGPQSMPFNPQGFGYGFNPNLPWSMPYGSLTAPYGMTSQQQFAQQGEPPQKQQTDHDRERLASRDPYARQSQRVEDDLRRELARVQRQLADMKSDKEQSKKDSRSAYLEAARLGMRKMAGLLYREGWRPQNKDNVLGRGDRDRSSRGRGKRSSLSPPPESQQKDDRERGRSRRGRNRRTPSSLRPKSEAEDDSESLYSREEDVRSNESDDQDLDQFDYSGYDESDRPRRGQRPRWP